MFGYANPEIVIILSKSEEHSSKVQKEKIFVVG